jgi:hypothetical protein
MPSVVNRAKKTTDASFEMNGASAITNGRSETAGIVEKTSPIYRTGRHGAKSAESHTFVHTSTNGGGTTVKRRRRRSVHAGSVTKTSAICITMRSYARIAGV